MGTIGVSIPSREQEAPRVIDEKGVQALEQEIMRFEQRSGQGPVAANTLRLLSDIVSNYEPVFPPGQDNQRDQLEAEFLKILMEVPRFIEFADANVREENFKNTRIRGMYRRLIVFRWSATPPVLPSEVGNTAAEILAWDEIAALHLETDITEDLFDGYVERLTGSPRKGRIYASQLGVRLNDCANRTSCALCGNYTQRVIGPELFLIDSRELVCEFCGRRYAGALVELLDVARRSKDQEPYPF